MKLNPKQRTPIKLSIIIPYTGHDPLREQALENLMHVLMNQDLIEVEASGEKAIIHEVIFVEQKTSVGYKGHSFGPLVNHIYVQGLFDFNKSWCMNIASKQAQGKWLLFIDADMLMPPNFLSAVINYHDNTKEPFFIAWNKIVTLPGRDNPFIRILCKAETLTAGGSFFVTKEFFNKVGRMDESYDGYGGEDNDFWVRGKHLLGKDPEYLDYVMLHQYHHWALAHPERLLKLYKTHSNTQIIIERLVAIDNGDMSRPKTIYRDDLRQGMSEKLNDFSN